MVSPAAEELLRIHWAQRLREDAGSVREAIVRASLEVLVEHGLTGWSLSRVAAAADCAKGSVLYHNTAKLHLLLRTTHRLRDALVEDRLALLARPATATQALDRLWDHLADEVEMHLFSTWLSLMASPEESLRLGASRTEAQLDQLRDATADAIGTPRGTLSPELLDAVLTGLQLRLHQGDEPFAVREAYDQFWLGVLSAA